MGVVGDGDGDGECVVGAAVVGLAVVGLAVVGLAVVGATVGAGAGLFTVGQVTEYFCGVDAATPGLVTTSTICPVSGTPARYVSGFTGCVPALLKVSWPGVFVPLGSCQ